jgi:hypothetical protein
VGVFVLIEPSPEWNKKAENETKGSHSKRGHFRESIKSFIKKKLVRLNSLTQNS